MNIIFFINGLGLGNSTRCYSIINELKKQNEKIKIIIASSGNGYWFFKSQKNIDKLYKLKQLKYEKKLGKLNAFGTVLKIFSIFKIFNQNTDYAIKLINKYKPQVVITDFFIFFQE